MSAAKDNVPMRSKAYPLIEFEGKNGNFKIA
jgi:hypothetical protein